MPIEQVRDVTTPTEMRTEIHRLMMHDVLVNHVMRLADYQGMNEVDRYSALAYYAIKSLNSVQGRLLDELVLRPPLEVVFHDGDGVRWRGGPT